MKIHHENPPRCLVEKGCLHTAETLDGVRTPREKTVTVRNGRRSWGQFIIYSYIYILLYILYILYIFYIYYILYILYILIYIFHIFYIFYIFYISLYHLIDMIRMMINHEIWTSRRLWLRWQTDIRKEPRDPGIGSVIWLPGMDYVLFRWCIDNICIWLYIYVV